MASEFPTSFNDSAFTLNQGEEVFDGSNELRFGIDSAVRADYVTPVAKFKFYDTLGNTKPGAPIIYIRMPGQFNSALANPFNEERGIMGPPSGSIGSMDTVRSIGQGLTDSVQSQILKAIGASAGFIASAGQSGRRQAEFTTRKFINEFQQLVYGGPVFRRFQLVFPFKPIVYDEADKMQRIIKTFRVASSPRIGASDIGALTLFGNEDRSVEQAAQQAEEGNQTAENSQQLQAGEVETQGNTLTMTYPDFCAFQIILYSKDNVEVLFQSKLCAIENISTDYGAQNKMTFFYPPNGTSGKYFPTEVNLSLSFREITLLTAADVSAEDTVIL